MRKVKYFASLLLLAVDVVLFAEVGKELTVSTSSLLLRRFEPLDETVLAWIMIALVILFIVGLAVLVRWIFSDFKRWVEQQLQQGEN